MDRLQEILAKLNVSVDTYKDMTEKDFEQFKVDSLNESEGNLNEKDGYSCTLCKNKGYIAKLMELPNGHYSHVMADCKCSEARRSIRRMQNSGLKDVIKNFTFAKFNATEDWQKSIKAAAMEYVKCPEGWFFIGGQSGSGKTMLCTAICREFLLAGRQVVYMLWLDDIDILMNKMRDPEPYERMFNRFKKAEVLYIDDLFKPVKERDGSLQLPAAWGVKKTYEILNYRAINNLPTIVSCEWMADELLDIDEATAGRIFEKAGDHSFNVTRDRVKNYRLKGVVDL